MQYADRSTTKKKQFLFINLIESRSVCTILLEVVYIEYIELLIYVEREYNMMVQQRRHRHRFYYFLLLMEFIIIIIININIRHEDGYNKNGIERMRCE